MARRIAEPRPVRPEPRPHVAGRPIPLDRHQLAASGGTLSGQLVHVARDGRTTDCGVVAVHRVRLSHVEMKHQVKTLCPQTRTAVPAPIARAIGRCGGQ